MLNQKVFTRKAHYEDIMLTCNLLEFLKLREKFIETIYERKLLHAIYKQ
jgi:hypothetical protein